MSKTCPGPYHVPVCPTSKLVASEYRTREQRRPARLPLLGRTARTKWLLIETAGQQIYLCKCHSNKNHCKKCSGYGLYEQVRSYTAQTIGLVSQTSYLFNFRIKLARNASKYLPDDCGDPTVPKILWSICWLTATRSTSLPSSATPSDTSLSQRIVEDPSSFQAQFGHNWIRQRSQEETRKNYRIRLVRPI